MRIIFNGRIHFANGEPASDVIVRIVDKDSAGIQDDDLTIIPGTSDKHGRFSLTYEPLRNPDYHTLQIVGAPNQPFNPPAPELGLPMPKTGDKYLPYLMFHYTFNGIALQHTERLGIFQTEFYLPVYAPVEFLPSRDGFKFANTFPGYFLPFSTPEFLNLKKIPPRYGMCGGMCAAAYDFALSGRAIPLSEVVPKPGTKLHRYLFRRQIDSLGMMGREAVKVAQWTCLPDDTPVGTQRLTKDELDQICVRLDNRNLVVLALVYEKAASMAELSRVIFNNHQVLAYSYEKDQDGIIRIHIYDPNLPGKDDAILQVIPTMVGEKLTTSGDQILLGVKSTQQVAGEFYKQVRGFFAMAYTPVKPPQNITGR